VALALEIAFWGRPVPAQFSIVRDTPGTPHEWVFERRANPREFWRARDTDHDGVMGEFHTPVGTFMRPGLRTEPKRWLVICLDGVPLGEMQRLWDRGYFREFYRPTATISTLPSDSEAALTEALRAAPGRGYEHRYFDRAQNRMRGGAWVTLTGAGVPYIRVLDYDAPGWAKGLVYVISIKSYRADLGRLRKVFLASHERVFLAHVATSDSLFHLLRSAQVEPFLLDFESLVCDFYLNARGEVGVLLFSDHGNTQTPGHAAPLEPFLEQHGWRLRETLAGPRDVAVPAYGLIGFIAVYSQPASATSLSRDLTALEGVDLVIARDVQAGSATILRGAGQARLRWTSDGSRFWYEAQQGDPLELLPVFEKLRAAGRLAPDGSAGDADVFAATWEGPYPDAAARIRTWALNHVQNPANILVSLKPGYFYGAGVFQHIVNFNGTHGALDAPSSLGFAMATRPLPPAVRLADLLPKEFLKNRNEATDKH
jgi:hypothetical protein